MKSKKSLPLIAFTLALVSHNAFATGGPKVDPIVQQSLLDQLIDIVVPAQDPIKKEKKD